MTEKVIFIGLGTMGYHIAGHLSNNKKVELSVFNRTITKAKKWQQEFNKNIVKSLTKEISNFDVIILCSGRDEDIENIFFDRNTGIVNNIKKCCNY